MTILLRDERALILHLPRTGGSWVRAVVKAAGLRIGRGTRRLYHRAVARKHALLPHYHSPDVRATVALFVRHPHTLYPSIYRWLQSSRRPRRVSARFSEGRWHPWREIVLLDRRRGFNPWVNTILDREGGFLTRLTEWYAGPPGSGLVTFVGQFEALEESMLGLLDRLGVGRSQAEQAIAAVPPTNLARAEPVEWEPATWKRVEELEAPLLRRFYRA